jgi:hypothetical protein
MTVPSSGWIYDKGAVDDPSELDKTGAGKKIQKNPGREIQQITPANINPVLSQLHEAHKLDIKELGPNPDLLGMVAAGGSSADAPGVTVQLRQKQGLTSLQNLFDGRTVANKMLGNHLVDMINKWPNEKIQRITGKPVVLNTIVRLTRKLIRRLTEWQIIHNYKHLYNMGSKYLLL